jgi:hypothetical protein
MSQLLTPGESTAIGPLRMQRPRPPVPGRSCWQVKGVHPRLPQTLRCGRTGRGGAREWPSCTPSHASTHWHACPHCAADSSDSDSLHAVPVLRGLVRIERISGARCIRATGNSAMRTVTGEGQGVLTSWAVGGCRVGAARSRPKLKWSFAVVKAMTRWIDEDSDWSRGEPCAYL